MSDEIKFEDINPGGAPVSRQSNKPSNGFAIASMVLGIISIVCCCISYFALVCAVAAIVFFIVDYKINKKASGMAIAGLICGIFGVLIGAFSIISDIIFRDDIESIWSSILGDIGSDVTQL